MDLLEECIAALLASKDKLEILPHCEANKINDSFYEAYPIARWGQIDWDKIEHKKTINKLDQIFALLAENNICIDKPIYIIWGDDNLPVIKCNLEDALKNIYEIIPLGVYGTAGFIILQMVGS